MSDDDEPPRPPAHATPPQGRRRREGPARTSPVRTPTGPIPVRSVPVVPVTDGPVPATGPIGLPASAGRTGPVPLPAAEHLDDDDIDETAESPAAPRAVRTGAIDLPEPAAAADVAPTPLPDPEPDRPPTPVVSTTPVSTGSVSTTPVSTGSVSTGPISTGPISTGPVEIAHGRRRSLSRHRDAGRLARTPSWVRSAGRRTWLVSLLPALLLTGFVQGFSIAGESLPTGAGRFFTGGSWAVLQPDALVGYTHWLDSPPFAWLQAGVLNRALLGGTGQTVLAATHDVQLVVALAGVLGVWLVARALPAGALAAFAAAAVFGISPFAVAVHAEPLPIDLAVVWLLFACRAAAARPGALAALAVGLMIAIAVLTAPWAALGALAPAWVLVRQVRRAPHPVLSALLAASAAVVVLAVATAVAAALAGEAPTAAAAQLNAIGAAATALQPAPGVGVASAAAWLRTDPLGLLVALAALAVAAPQRRMRPVVALALLLVALAFLVLGPDATTIPALLLPVAAVAVAAAVDRAIVALGAPRFVVSLAGSGWLTGTAALLIVAAIVWGTALGGLQRSSAEVSQVQRWLHTSVPAGQVVLVDLAAWPDLMRGSHGVVGWYVSGSTGSAPVASSPALTDADYVVTDDRLRTGDAAQAGSVLRRSLAVATFGTGRDALQVRAVKGAPSPSPSPTPTPTAAPPSAAERAAAAADRRTTGAELARNPRLELSGADRARLTSGDVDARIALVLAGLATTHRVGVASFPSGAGGTDDDRTSVLIDTLDGRKIPASTQATGVLLQYLHSLRGSFAASRIRAESGGVLATFTPDPTFRPGP